MKTLNRIRMALIYVASAATVVATAGFIATGMWHLLALAIVACAMGLSLKNNEDFNTIKK